MDETSSSPPSSPEVITSHHFTHPPLTMDNTVCSTNCVSPPPQPDNHQLLPIMITSHNLTPPPPPVTMDNTVCSMTCASPPPENSQLLPIMFTSHNRTPKPVAMDNTVCSTSSATPPPPENHRLLPVMFNSHSLTPPPATMDNAVCSTTCASPSSQQENHQLPPMTNTSLPPTTMDNTVCSATCASPPSQENHHSSPMMLTCHNQPPPPPPLLWPPVMITSHYLPPPITAPLLGPLPVQFYHLGVPVMCPCCPFAGAPMPVLFRFQPMTSYFLEQVFMPDPYSVSEYRLWEPIFATVVNSVDGNRSVIPVHESPSSVLAARLERMKNSETHSDDDFSFFSMQPWEYFEGRKIVKEDQQQRDIT